MEKLLIKLMIVLLSVMDLLFISTQLSFVSNIIEILTIIMALVVFIEDDKILQDEAKITYYTIIGIFIVNFLIMASLYQFIASFLTFYLIYVFAKILEKRMQYEQPSK